MQRLKTLAAGLALFAFLAATPLTAVAAATAPANQDAVTFLFDKGSEGDTQPDGDVLD